MVATPDCQFVYVLFDAGVGPMLSDGFKSKVLTVFEFDPDGPSLEMYTTRQGGFKHNGQWGMVNITAVTYDPLDYEYPIAVGDGEVKRLTPGHGWDANPSLTPRWDEIEDTCMSCLTTMGDSIVIAQLDEYNRSGFRTVAFLRRTPGESWLRNETMSEFVSYNYTKVRDLVRRGDGLGVDGGVGLTGGGHSLARPPTHSPTHSHRPASCGPTSSPVAPTT